MLTIFTLIQLSGFSQDLIILKNNEPISCFVIEVSKDSVRYITVNNAYGPIHAINRLFVSMIHFRESLSAIPNNLIMDSVIHAQFPIKDTIKVAIRNRGPINALYSLLVPGLGDYKVRRSYWLINMITYGLIGSGIYYKIQSDKLYKSYKTSENSDYSNYNIPNDYHHRFLILTGLGAVVWLSDVLLTGIKGIRNNNTKHSQSTARFYNQFELIVENNGQAGLRWYF